ncbi:hypothetical protein [Medusavirus stheno T3]|uniref:Uncharacterized protein n=1 Tax=Medusavirus stheno T3 TaxID=3069717 RepID=A0A7S8BES4_9VIRU|nr:hypothetical protein QKU73_gp337 [Acanthamoeba castellanii medusavirus]QPB44438.1 hypothetical protein [Medusavirus stheno T3]
MSTSPKLPPEEIDQVPAFIRFQMALDTIATAHAAIPLMGRSLTNQSQLEEEMPLAFKNNPEQDA